MIGRTIGRYRILEKLGEGGMGSVWKAEDPVLRRTVAVKVLAAGLWDSPEARERFLREARAVSRLEHSGIAAVHDFGEVDGSPFIAFQFVAGRTFHQLLADGPLPAARAFELAAAAAEALSHAHARGVLHRDVTANNLMLADDGRVVVVDFGLALPEGGTRVTRTAMSMGTVGYMAPELFRGEPASERTDVYGLGAVLYRLLTGRLPFEASTLEAMMYRMMNDPLAPPSQTGARVPTACDAPVLRALARDPAERWASAAEMAAALRAARASLGSAAARPAVLSGAVTVARRAGGTLARAAHRARRSKLVAGIAAGLAVALVVALGWAWRAGLLPLGGEKVVAVLPIHLEAADVEDLGHIPEALGDELVARLGELPGVRVLPWETSRRFGNSTKPLREIARELHARFIVDGSLRSEGGRAHITLTVLDAARDRPLGKSVMFVEAPDDLFALERRATLGIAAKLSGELDARARAKLASAPAGNPEAYDLFARGASYFAGNDPATHGLAEMFYRKALDLEPTLAAAWVGMGAIASDKYFRGEAGGLQNLETAERNYRHALQLEPHDMKAVQGLVLVHYERSRNEEALKVAAAAGPRKSRDPNLLMVHGVADVVSGMSDRALESFDAVLSLDPANRGAAWYRVIGLNWSGDLDGCIQAGREFVKRFGEDPEVLTWMGVSYAQKGMSHEAMLCLDRAIELFGQGMNLYVVAWSAAVQQAAGDSTGARARAAKWLPVFRKRAADSPQNGRAQEAAMLMEAFLGDRAGVQAHAEALLAAQAGSGVALASVYGFIATSMIGDKPLALRYLKALRETDLAPLADLHVSNDDAISYLFHGGPSDPRTWPEYQALKRDALSRRDELRRRY